MAGDPPQVPMFPRFFQDVLSPREQEIGYRMAVGFERKEIARELGISIQTVDCHRAKILAKLGVRNNVALALRAVRDRMIVP